MSTAVARATAVTEQEGPTVDLPRAGGRGTSLALLGEVLLSGAVLAVLSIPLVTAVPALAAGAVHLRGHLAGEPDSLGTLVRRLASALRELWLVGLALPALLLVLAFDWWLARTGVLPGGDLVAVVTAVVAVAAVVVALRLAGTWRPGVPTRVALRTAARSTVRDPVGSALLVAAVVVVVAVVWMLVPLMLVVPGLLALAVVAVEERRTRTDEPSGEPDRPV